jgi:aspartate kinase
MDIKVFKFGGASVNSADGVRNVCSILGQYPDDNIAIVVSAMGKTTNAMEELLKFFMEENPVDMVESFYRIRNFHQEILDDLFIDKMHKVFSEIDHLFENLRGYLSSRHLASATRRGYDFEYDQVVSYGELFATTIVHHYLSYSHISSKLFDVRDLIRTDSTYRDASVNWEITAKNIRKYLSGYFRNQKGPRRIAVIPGFTGGDAQGNTTTLGREGSDYTAAILAHSLGTREVTIWKDVPGIMNADPKWFPHARKLDRLSYREAIELAYYGGSVIHPKTIKPLENANILLRVRSFLKPHLEGTLIENMDEWKMAHPVYILKRNQVLISISPRDFSFIVEENLSQIFDILARNHVRVNVMQNSAISFTVCVDDDNLHNSSCLTMLQANYRTRYNEKVELVTIRHYNPAAINRITKGRTVLMEQKTRNTVHLVLQ